MRPNIHSHDLATLTRFGSSLVLTLPWTLGKKMQEPCHPFGALLPELTVFSKHGTHHRHTLQLQENYYQGGRIRLRAGTLG